VRERREEEELEDEFCLEIVIGLVERKGEGDEDGVEGVDGELEGSPKSFRALRITE
jgi:hypothetical protein